MRFIHLKFKSASSRVRSLSGSFSQEAGFDQLASRSKVLSRSHRGSSRVKSITTLEYHNYPGVGADSRRKTTESETGYIPGPTSINVL